MDEMRNALIEEIKKLDHEQKKAVLAFVRKLAYAQTLRDSHRFGNSVRQLMDVQYSTSVR